MGDSPRLDSSLPRPFAGQAVAAWRNQLLHLRKDILIIFPWAQASATSKSHSGECEVARDRRLRDSVIWWRGSAPALRATTSSLKTIRLSGRIVWGSTSV